MLTEDSLHAKELLNILKNTYEPVNPKLSVPQKDAVYVVANPDCFYNSPGKTIWLDFYNHDSWPGWYIWLNENEVKMLKNHNYTLWEPEDQVSNMLFNHLKGIRYTKETLTLITVDKSGDSITTQHPLMSLLRAKVTNLEDFIIPVDIHHYSDIPGWKFPEMEEVTPIDLPVKKAAHNIQHGYLIQTRETESYSSIERLIQHPFDWVFEYPMEIKPGYSYELPDEETTMGNVAHHFINQLFEKGGNHPAHIKEILNKTYFELLDKAILEHGSILLLDENKFHWHRLRDQLMASVLGLLDLIQENNLEIIGTEVEITEKINRLDDQVIFGILDLMLSDKYGNTIVIDLKWSRSLKRYREKLQQGKAVQLILYKELIPWAFGSKKKVPVDSIKEQIVSSTRFNKIEIQEKMEMARLLYVGFTRGRDLLVTTSYNNYNASWLTHAFGDRHSVHRLNTMSEGEYQIDLFGCKQDIAVNIRNFEGKIREPNPRSTTITALKKDREKRQFDPKYLSPSKLPFLENPTVTLVQDFKQRIALAGSNNVDEAMIGNCLHQIFSVWHPAMDQTMVNEIIQNTLVAHQLESVFPEPEQIHRAISNLYDYLRSFYGNPVHVFREIPLQAFNEGQVIRGEADMLWEGKEHYTLVDYKSYPGRINTILEHGHAHYAGKYSGQLQAYTNIIEVGAGNNKPVENTLLYYPVVGCLVGIKW